MKKNSLFFIRFHLYLDKYVVLILSEKKSLSHILSIHVILSHIGYSVSFHSMSNFTIDFLRISFSCFTRFFKRHSPINSCRICFKFKREIGLHKTQLHGMMRAFCCTYFRISVPCVRIHNLEKKIEIFLLFHIICSNIIYLLNPSTITKSTLPVPCSKRCV